MEARSPLKKDPADDRVVITLPGRGGRRSKPGIPGLLHNEMYEGPIEKNVGPVNPF